MQTTEARKLYAGADLHGNNLYLSVCDEQGHELFSRRVKTDLEAVNKAMRPYWDRVEVMGVESTFNWYWFVDGLRAQGHAVELGNPARMQQYSGLKNTDDRSDARWLAEMARLGIFPKTHVCPEQIRAVRDALRRRQLFVRRRTQVILSFESLLARYGVKPPGSRSLLKWTRADIEATRLDPFVQLQMRTLLKAAVYSDRLAEEIESAVLETVKPSESYRRVQHIPGIGRALGMMVILESGDFGRFPNAGCYASYCRAVRSERTSNHKKKGENNRHNGNPYLAWAFIEAATFAIRFYPPIQSWHDRKKKRTNTIVAKKALAAKLAKATWHVMNGEHFEMKKMFG